MVRRLPDLVRREHVCVSYFEVSMKGGSSGWVEEEASDLERKRLSNLGNSPSIVFECDTVACEWVELW